MCKYKQIHFILQSDLVILSHHFSLASVSADVLGGFALAFVAFMRWGGAIKRKPASDAGFVNAPLIILHITCIAV